MIGHSWEGLQRGVGRLGDRRGYFWRGRWAARFIAYQYYGLLMNLCPKHILPFFARGFLVAAQMSPHSPLLGNHSSRRFRYDEVPLFRFICFTALPPLFLRPDPVVADRQCRRGSPWQWQFVSETLDSPGNYTLIASIKLLIEYSNASHVDSEWGPTCTSITIS